MSELRIHNFLLQDGNEDVLFILTAIHKSIPHVQWDNIASKVWATLTNSAGVKFHGLIEVS